MMRANWKRTALFLMLLVIALACGGCAGGPQKGKDEGEAMRIVTSFYPMYLLTANVTQGIDGVSVRNMAAPEVGCLHDYQLLPGDLRALENANVLVVNGAGMEQFLDKVLAQRQALPIIEASAGIPLLLDEAEPHQGEEQEHAYDDGHGHEANAHVWVDPRNAAAQTRTIARRLGELDPAHAGAYAANGEAYARRLEALYDKMLVALATLPRRDIFTFHEAFIYFAEAFDLHVAGVVERDPGTDPGTRDLADIVERVRAEQVAALFVEPQYSARVANIIAAETGARIYTLDPVVTGPFALDAYESAMERNLQALLEALS